MTTRNPTSRSQVLRGVRPRRARPTRMKVQQAERLIRQLLRRSTPVLTGAMRRSLRIRRSQGKLLISYLVPYGGNAYRHHRRRGNDFVRQAHARVKRQLGVVSLPAQVTTRRYVTGGGSTTDTIQLR